MAGPDQASDPRGDTPGGDTAAYWRRNLRITAALLTAWFVVTFVAAFYARELSFSFFGWPFSFWVAAQGALLVYLVLIGLYARYMNRLDGEYGAPADDSRG